MGRVGNMLEQKVIPQRVGNSKKEPNRLEIKYSVIAMNASKVD